MKLCQSCRIKYPSNTVHCTTGSCGALLVPIPELDPGTRINNKFRIVGTLGDGGFGIVYLAEQALNPTAERRALKFPKSDAIRDANGFSRFQKEAALNLLHPNIVHVYDLEQADDGSYYFPMEYVPGCELRDLIATGPFRVERALAMARGVADGLQAAHARSIVHRDVKPENIRVANPGATDEIPKLIDFGIAAFKESNSRVSTNLGPGFTMTYAAPEQWQGQRGKYLDGRTDLYALGGVLYEMLTGRTPFVAEEYGEWAWQHENAPRIPPSLLRPELAQWPGVDDLLLHTLAIERDDRPAEAAEFLRYLADVEHRRAPHKPWRPIAAPRLTIPVGPSLRTPTVPITTGPGQSHPGQSGPRPIGPGPSTTVPTFGQLGDSDKPKPDRKSGMILAAILFIVFGAAGFAYYIFERPTPDSVPIQTGSDPGMISPVPSGGANSGPKKLNPPPPPASLTVTCDMACNWKIEGGPQGKLAAKQLGVEPLAGNRVTVKASAADEQLEPQTKTLAVLPGERLTANFDFAEALLAKRAQEELVEEKRRQQEALVEEKREQQIANLLREADAKHDSGDSAGAVTAYNSVLRIDPNNAAAKADKAQILKECEAQHVTCE